MFSLDSLRLKSNSDATRMVRGAYEQYQAADNKPGDTQPAADKVELSDGRGSLQVSLEKSPLRFQYAERVVDEQGATTIRSFDAPRGFNVLGSRLNGFEVRRDDKGNYQGEELKWVPGWGSPGFFGSDRLSRTDAEQMFRMQEARFQGDFAPK